MSTADSAALDRAIAQTVADLVATATGPEATAASFALARDAAQMVTLEGLDHALAACSAHVGGVIPPDVAALLDRLGRLATTVRESCDLTPFRDAGAELYALADQLNGTEWVESEEPESEQYVAVATLQVSDVLDDVTIVGDDSRAVALRSRLLAPVAAAVRAAIDWLAPPGAVGPVRLYGEPSLLEIRMERIRTDRLYAAHRVIAAAGGNLGRALDGVGWVLRVPSFTARASYLMVIQGGVRIAIPWHSVLKLRIVPVQAGPGSVWSMEHAVLAPLATPAPEAPEQPVVLIGHGLKRAYLVADRLIWRMTAQVCENEWGSPGGGLHDTVRTEDGEVFWVADPTRLLADVGLPEIAVEAQDAAAEEPELSAADVRPLGDKSDLSAAPQAGVQALELAAPDAAYRSSAGDAPEALEPTATPEPKPPVARALVADDSFTTRLVLAHMLEAKGFIVDTVARSADLMERLEAASWTVLFTDLELPDGSGPEWLRQVCRAAASSRTPVHVVALVRDGGDLDVARAAGVEDTLLKPFARESLAALLARYNWTEA